MNAPIALVACAAGALLFTQTSRGASITIDALGGPVNLQSGTIAGILNATPGNLTTSDLHTLHSELNASGIDTDAAVTFLLADTVAGVSFIALVDAPQIQGEAIDGADGPDSGGGASSQLGMTTVGSLHNTAWVNDHQQDITTLIGFPGPSQIAAGSYTWSEADAGDAFAWTGLLHGDGFTYNFTDMSASALRDNQPFQFVSFMNNTWTVIDFADFNGFGQFAFSATIATIPLPAPLALGLAGLACVGVRRGCRNERCAAVNGVAPE